MKFLGGPWRPQYTERTLDLSFNIQRIGITGYMVKAAVGNLIIMKRGLGNSLFWVIVGTVYDSFWSYQRGNSMTLIVANSV